MTTLDRHIELWQLETMRLMIPPGFTIEHYADTLPEQVEGGGAGMSSKMELRIGESTYGCIGMLPKHVLDSLDPSALHTNVASHVYGLMHTLLRVLEHVDATEAAT